ncbi:MAG: CHAP domain-containing protein [bacterium]|nr:CHAP domain-containing protein [bacterium]
MRKVQNFVRTALSEVRSPKKGNSNFAGEEIEKYLSTLRKALNDNGNTHEFDNLTKGFSWCAAFVYYCCLESEIHICPKPIKGDRYTLAAIPTWIELAENTDILIKETNPAVGDIIIFNQLVSTQNLDHMGVIVEVRKNEIITCELTIRAILTLNV